MPIVFTGNNWDIINQAITASYVEVTYTRHVKNYLIQARGDSNVLIKRLNSDTKYFTLKSGSSASRDILLASPSADSASLGFFATDSGTDTLEVIVIF